MVQALTDMGFSYTKPGCSCSGKTGIYRRGSETATTYQNGRVRYHDGRLAQTFRSIEEFLGHLELDSIQFDNV